MSGTSRLVNSESSPSLKIGINSFSSSIKLEISIFCIIYYFLSIRYSTFTSDILTDNNQSEIDVLNFAIAMPNHKHGEINEMNQKYLYFLISFVRSDKTEH
jgi:hypothetical protein